MHFSIKTDQETLLSMDYLWIYAYMQYAANIMNVYNVNIHNV